MALLPAFFTKALDLILPPRCGLCGCEIESSGALCPDCWHEMTFISTPFCACCGIPLEVALPDGESHEASANLCPACLSDPPPYTMARAPLVYGTPAAKLVSRFKYSAHLWLLPLFMPWLERVAPELLDKADCLVPVPLHPFRLIWRGYNQAALMAQALGRSAQIPVQLTALKRTRYTRPQVGLERQIRLKNVRGAFNANPQEVAGKCVVLVDDVLTTGATLSACCEALLEAGAREVRVLTLARVVLGA